MAISYNVQQRGLKLAVNKRKLAAMTPAPLLQPAIPELTTTYREFDIDDNGEHGEIFTRRWIVNLILDLVGYDVGRPLHETVLVEPACGSGAFLSIIAERLSASVRRRGL